MRSEYQRGRGTPCLVAVYQDATGKAMDMALAYGQGIGGASRYPGDHLQSGDRDRPVRRAGSALRRRVRLMKAGFETLVEAGYAPENAYFECVHEMKLIVDLIYESGFAGMRYSISNTAEYGDYITGPKIVTDETKKP